MTREKRVARGSGQADPRVVYCQTRGSDPRIRLADPTLETLSALLGKGFSATNIKKESFGIYNSLFKN